MSQKIQILDPVAPFRGTEQTDQLQLESLQGKVFGFIDNNKPNFLQLANDLAEIASERFASGQAVTHTKEGSAVPAGDVVYAAFAEQCDIVIAGSGD